MVAGDGSSIEAKPEVKEEEMAVKEEGDQSSHAGDQSMTTATEDIAVHDAVVPDSGDVGHQKFCESIMEALGRLLTKYGSWGSFLKSRFGTTESATECCDFLHELCEANEPGHSLQHPLTSVSLGTLNTGGSKPIALPLGAFSFASSWNQMQIMPWSCRWHAWSWRMAASAHQNLWCALAMRSCTRKPGPWRFYTPGSLVIWCLSALVSSRAKHKCIPCSPSWQFVSTMKSFCRSAMIQLYCCTVRVLY